MLAKIRCTSMQQSSMPNSHIKASSQTNMFALWRSLMQAVLLIRKLVSLTFALLSCLPTNSRTCQYLKELATSLEFTEPASAFSKIKNSLQPISSLTVPGQCFHQLLSKTSPRRQSSNHSSSSVKSCISTWKRWRFSETFVNLLDLHLLIGQCSQTNSSHLWRRLGTSKRMRSFMILIFRSKFCRCSNSMPTPLRSESSMIPTRYGTPRCLTRSSNGWERANTWEFDRLLSKITKTTRECSDWSRTQTS